MNKGQQLWQRAKQIIPGGNGLISKRPERYFPNWPTYYKYSGGVSIIDLDDNIYIDMAQMGMGTAILGYNDHDINNAVIHHITEGVSTTLNSRLEVRLAEKLRELNPTMDMVRFARTGGEAMAIAVRIARTYTGRDQVAFCGYHGWHDWHMTNVNGVPDGLRDTAFPFDFNRIDGLRNIVKDHNIGTIVLESARYQYPNQAFLIQIKEICKAYNIVLIADEITSGWRRTDGGVYKLYGEDYQPDIVVYGKAMGNGFAISAVVGKKEVMQSAEETFISSTFWSESVGFAAALATIDKLVKNKVWEHLDQMGLLIAVGWTTLAHKHNLAINVSEVCPLITFDFKDASIHTLFTEEMLKRGYLAYNKVYVSYAHTPEIIAEYLKAVDEVFKLIAERIN